MDTNKGTFSSNETDLNHFGYGTFILNNTDVNREDNRMNQSKLELNTCSWRKARENEFERVTIGLGLTSD